MSAPERPEPLTGLALAVRDVRVRWLAGLLVLPLVAGFLPFLALWLLTLAFAADCLGADDAPPVLETLAICLGFSLAVLLFVKLVAWLVEIAVSERPKLTFTRGWKIAAIIFLLMGTSPFIYAYGGLRTLPASCEGLQMS